VLEPTTNVLGLDSPITFVKDFAERLRYARVLRGFSQASLARACGLSQGAIANYENRTRKTAKGIFRIAKVLEVSPSWLAMGAGPMAETPMTSGYDASDVRGPGNLRDTGTGSKTQEWRLAAWPFNELAPEDFWSLSAHERKMIEQSVIALTRSLHNKNPKD
jgi:transcriptional regulator with XRE-family HTH domain